MLGGAENAVIEMWIARAVQPVENAMQFLQTEVWG